ncbi:hypothetical protein LO763_21050 [Glycomyces sp. A-F 0318]|uniref:hypothetical protein n=1 Tax=Glycomyces amatae TaxID=2881355 RepID=UPI001E501F6D|nr:hypothetical protein [Glycomyces amatae]MCD0446103.1 hypothetical protein [Glycomyces amatae]
MTFPPPPPDRVHLQYQPSPVPQQPQQMGPGGAYGPVQHSPGQPVPGQLPPASMTMGKPGTITGIQAILWILLALSGIGNLFSIIGMVNFFNPLQLLVLAYTVYSTAQALISPVQIARGKRWAWIWSLVSAIIGLVMSAVAIVFGVIMIDFAVYTLLIGIALAGLYGTFLGLLCSKSARQWILMHRIQRGEVQLPGMAGPVGMAGAGQAAPQRPEAKPGAVTFAVVLMVLLMALAAWAVYSAAMAVYWMTYGTMPMDAAAAWYGVRFPLMAGTAAFLVLVCALISVIGLHRGSFGARVFTLVWTSVLVLACGFVAAPQLLDFLRFGDIAPPPVRTSWLAAVARDVAITVLVIAVFIAALLPGVRAWTPGRGTAALVVMVPMGQPQAAQPGPYGPPQPGGYAPQPPGQQPPQPPYGGY